MFTYLQECKLQFYESKLI